MQETMTHERKALLILFKEGLFSIFEKTKKVVNALCNDLFDNFIVLFLNILIFLFMDYKICICF